MTTHSVKQERGGGLDGLKTRVTTFISSEAQKL